jgi:DNA-binding beta-propeller fold protein YncE
MRVPALASCLLIAVGLSSARLPTRQVSPAEYVLLVASEAADQIAMVRFGPAGGRVEKAIDTGIMPNDIDGPHGLAVAPGGGSYFVSLAHGQPFGSVWKYSPDGKVLARAALAMFPATISVTPDGEFLYVVNFNLHGDPVPSSVSVLTAEPLQEIARIPTCLMPHGSRINPAGTRHYSACMMDDTLVEIDTGTLRVSRHFVLTRGVERGAAGPPVRSQPLAAGSHAGHGTENPPPASTACSPTWAQPSADGLRVFVACNGTSEIVEVNGADWRVTRRFPAGNGVYNLAVTPNGRLLATNRRDQSVSIFDVESGRELKKLRTSRRVVHGVVVSPDGRYAFVSVEGVAAEPGTVEMIDLTTLTTTATVDVGPQAGGLDIWRVEKR